MNLDANSILASLLIGSIGMVAFIYGKRQSRLPQMITGIVMIVYPYFVPNVYVMLGIGVALIVAMWGAIRLGY